jgi:tetratricopeptide (TPR) repeat protein
MIWLARRLVHDYSHWEKSAKIAFVMGMVLLPVALGAVILCPPEIRLAALVGTGGLILVLQVTVLWANRRMVTAFTQAQRHYLAGEFDRARDILEAVYHEGKADARMLTLLGNSYRQLGRLEESHRVLYEALDKAPNHYFPLYGFGRTLLSEGNYAEAAEVLSRAIDAGAPTAVCVDLAEAYYRAGYHSEALKTLQNPDLRSFALEPHRHLFAAYLLHCLSGASPPEIAVIRSGLPYWEASAQRFRHTRYGSDIAQDLQRMLGSIE